MARRARVCLLAVAGIGSTGCLLVAPFEPPPSGPDTGVIQHRDGTDPPELEEGGACDEGGCDAPCAGPCETAEEPDAECAPTFRVDLPGSLLRRAVLDAAGTLVVVGATADTGRVVAFDRCTGDPRGSADVTIEGATSSWLHSIASVGDEVVVTGAMRLGDDPGDGIYARLRMGTLEILQTTPLWGSTGLDETGDIVAPEAGDIWIVGTTAVDSSPRPWGIKADDAGNACGFAAAEGAGSGRAAVAWGADVLFSADIDGQARLLRYDLDSCSATEPCGCPVASASDPIGIGTATTIVLHTLVVGDRLFAAGLGADTGAAANDYFGFVAELAGPGGQAVATFRWDPSERIDGFTALASDGARLYVAGAQGWDGSEGDLSSASAALLALPLTLGAPDWTTTPEGMDVVWGIAADADAVYASGDGEPGAAILKCTPDGACP